MIPRIDYFDDLNVDPDLTPHTCDVAKVDALAVSPNFASQAGTTANKLTIVAREVPCLVAESRGQDTTKWGRRSVECSHVVYFAGAIELMIDWFIVYNGRRLRVMDVLNELSTGKVSTAFVQEISA